MALYISTETLYNMVQIWKQKYPFTSWPWFYLPPYNSVEQGIVDETCTFTYKLDGATVATVTVVYTDATLQTIVSVTKT